jgi:hypothetical protein
MARGIRNLLELPLYLENNISGIILSHGTSAMGDSTFSIYSLRFVEIFTLSNERELDES